MDYDEWMTPDSGGDAAGIATTTIATSAVAESRVLGLYDILIPLLGAFIIVLNLAVVVSSGLILKKGQQPRSTYLFLGNVGLTDLLTGFAVLFGQFYPRQYRGELSCAIQIGMIVSATVTSVYSVGLIAIDRFLYILYGLQYQRWIYPNRARLLILITWIIGIIIGFLPAFGWRGDTENGKRCWFILVAPPELVLLTTIVGFLPILLVVILYSIILHHALRKVMQLKNAARNRSVGAVSGNLRMHVGASPTTTTTTSTSMPRSSNSSSAIVEMRDKTSTSSPPLTMTDNNGAGGGGAALSDTEEPLQPKNRRRFFNFLSRHKATPAAENNNGVGGVPAVVAGTNNGLSTSGAAATTRSNKSLSKWKAIKVVLFTTGSFVVTWVPYFIASTMYVNCDWTETPARCRNIQVAIASPLAILGFANSLTNPIIYAWWHNGFRESAKAIFCGSTCRKKRRSESDGPSSSSGQATGSSSAAAASSSRVGQRGGRSATATTSSGGAEGTLTHRGGASHNNGRSFGVSTTTLDVSGTDLDLSDGASSDVESALQRRGQQDPGDTEQWPSSRQPVNGASGGGGAVNVSNLPEASGGRVAAIS